LSLVSSSHVDVAARYHDLVKFNSACWLHELVRVDSGHAAYPASAGVENRTRLSGGAAERRGESAKRRRKPLAATHIVSVRIRARGTVTAAFVVKQAATACVYIPVQSRRDGS
jgi:hypothetical protein